MRARFADVILILLLVGISTAEAAEVAVKPTTTPPVYQAIVPFAGGVPGAEGVFYSATATVTNPWDTEAMFWVDSYYDLAGSQRDPRCFCTLCLTTTIAPHETRAIPQFQSCSPLAAYIVNSNRPLVFTNDVDEYAIQGRAVRTGVSTIPVEQSLFPAGSTVVIPNIQIFDAQVEPARANLVFFSRTSAATTPVVVTLTRRAGHPDPPFREVMTLTLESGKLHIIPLPFIGEAFIPPDWATQVMVTSDAPFYAGASQILGKHTAYRRAFPVE